MAKHASLEDRIWDCLSDFEMYPMRAIQRMIEDFIVPLQHEAELWRAEWDSISETARVLQEKLDAAERAIAATKSPWGAEPHPVCSACLDQLVWEVAYTKTLPRQLLSGGWVHSTNDDCPF